MKTIVTGGAGFIGSSIVDLLVSKGIDVAVVDNLSTGVMQNVHPQAEFYNADIRDLDRLTHIFEDFKPDSLVHLAAQIDVQESIRHPYRDADINIQGTINLLDLVLRFHVGKVVYASSAAVYGVPENLPIDEKHPIRPISFYGVSKYTPEQYIRVYSELGGFQYTILRYANVYGPRQNNKGEAGVISVFIPKILRDQSVVIFGNGLQTRDFVYVTDVAEANWRALEACPNKVLNISTDTTTSLTELVNVISTITGKAVSIIHEEGRPGDIAHSRLSNAKARHLLGWTPRFTLEQGLARTIEAMYHV